MLLRVMRLLVLSFLVFSPFCTWAQEAPATDAEDAPEWREPARVELTLHGGTSEKITKWEALFGRRGDFLLDVEEKSGDRVTNGRILLVSGQAMVVQGMDLDAEYAIDAIDMPAFHFQLLYGILEALFPEGPESVSREQPVEFAESDDAIEVGTASATGEFAAPWFVKGTVSADEHRTVGYDLTFTFTVDPAEAMTFTLHLKGQWIGETQQDTIGDDFAIAGWDVYEVGPQVADVEGGTVADFSARPTNETYRTVGELRNALADREGNAIPE